MMKKAGKASYRDGGSQRKKAASALKEALGIFKLVFDSAIDGILVADIQSKRIHLANKAMCRMIGYSIEEFKKLSVADLHPPESLPYVIAQFERQLKKAGLAENIPFKRKDGSVFYADINSTKAMLNGKPHLFGVFRDITERKKTGEELSKRYEQFRQIFDLSPDGMAISTLDGGKILEVNDAMLAIFGGRREEVIGHTAKELKIWDDPSDRDLTVKKLIKQNIIQNSEALLRRRSGELFYAALSAGFIDYEGKKCVIFTARNIDKLKKMEMALKKTLAELKEEKELLAKKNIAFQEAVKEIELEKNRLKDDVIINANHLILPIVKRIRLKDVSSRKYLELLEKSLDELTSSFGRKLTLANFNLTPKEIEVCNMIRSGLTTKEMSELLNLSSKTLDQHRKNIRRKLALSHKGTNLASYLQSL